MLTRSRPADEVVAAIGEDNVQLGDAADLETVEAALDGIDDVAFCAGGLLPSASERDPERDRELHPEAGPNSCSRRCAARPGVTLTYLSSGGTVYGEPERLPVRESDPTAPASAYGKLHLACEEEIEVARREHGLTSRILRCSTVYGEHQRPERGQGAIVTFLHRIARGEQIDLYGDGTTIRDYIYVGDVARAVVALIAPRGGPPTGQRRQRRGDLAARGAAPGRGGGRAGSLEIARHPERGFDVHQIVLDTTLLRQTIDLEITPLSRGIARTQRWLSTSGAGAGVKSLDERLNGLRWRFEAMRRLWSGASRSPT